MFYDAVDHGFDALVTVDNHAFADKHIIISNSNLIDANRSTIT
jgi:hypothetical protein